ncbi:MAG: septum formation initiator family protein [Chloroflexi bacterium]|nr:septum formation initiator family protein [Chloroflexota bacterium]
MRRVFVLAARLGDQLWAIALAGFCACNMILGMSETDMFDAGIAEAGSDELPVQPRAGWKRLTSVQVMLAVALALGLVLILNFSGRISLDRDLGRIHAQFEAEIADLQSEQQRLRLQLDYVKSDAYVEIWARDDGKMIREGEVLIMPKSIASDLSAQTATTSLVAFETTAPKPKNWQLWWALFFDSPPPDRS